MTEPRALWPALWRGLAGRCPRCGVGAMFAGFTRVRDTCPACGEALHHHRADDMPPYAVTFIVGHVVVGLGLSLELAYAPPLWLDAAIFVPLTLGLALALLRPAKGAVVTLQWALGMHGFAPDPDADAEAT